MNRFFKEFIGTTIYILIACGIAATSNIILATSINLPGAFSLLTIAITFGLAYNIISLIFNSECKFNPMLTIIDILTKKTKLKTGLSNILAELLGGFLGAELLGIILNGNYGALGANAYGELSIIGSTIYQAFAVEIIVSLVLSLVYLQIKNENRLKIFSLALTLTALFAIPYTNFGANPARSIGPAIMMGGKYLKQLWVFILSPVLGALLSIPISKIINKK